MSIFQRSNHAINFNDSFTGRLSFRAKVLLAMMLVVFAVTSATVYLAEKNRRMNHQQLLNAQFQNRVQSFLKIQEAQSGVITEKCLTLSHAVRLRAALEERDVDDLYTNALTELQGILEHSGSSPENSPEITRASFFRFLDAAGSVLPPENHPVGLTDQPTLPEALSSMAKVLREDEDQAVGFIAGARKSALGFAQGCADQNSGCEREKPRRARGRLPDHSSRRHRDRSRRHHQKWHLAKPTPLP
ncbi:MAG: hypothetical protein M3N12_02130 [Verrucomicrobiota bacterium]|nr:hypothetical protein [Verrucomicrobiota bacterium]